MRIRFKTDNIVLIVCFIMFCLIPTSKASVIYGADRMVLYWLVATLVALYMLFRNGLSNVRYYLIAGAMLVYMFIVTLISQEIFNNYHVSLARIAPILVLFVFLGIRVHNFPTMGLARKLLNCFNIIAIILGVAVLIGVTPIKDFIYNYYNQYYQTAVYNAMYVNNKPVMTFGVHTYASFYYFIFFILNYFTYEKTQRKIYLYYAIAMIALTICLFSVTSLLYSIAMIGYLIYKLGKRSIWLWVAFLFGVIVLSVWQFDALYQGYYTSLTSQNNGFLARYIGHDTVFANNIKVISSSLGIGFNVLDDINIGYSDSGYVVYLTMGHIPLAVFIYWSLYIFLKRNIHADYRKLIVFAVFSFEVALPASFNYRFIFIMIFILYYLRELETDETC